MFLLAMECIGGRELRCRMVSSHTHRGLEGARKGATGWSKVGDDWLSWRPSGWEGPWETPVGLLRVGVHTLLLLFSFSESLKVHANCSIQVARDRLCGLKKLVSYGTVVLPGKPSRSCAAATVDDPRRCNVSFSSLHVMKFMSSTVVHLICMA